MRVQLFSAVVLAAILAACADIHGKAGFQTAVHEGRLWVFTTGDKDYDVVAKGGEPKVVVTRIGEGPGGMTVKSNNAKTIDAYLAAK